MKVIDCYLQGKVSDSVILKNVQFVFAVTAALTMALMERINLFENKYNKKKLNENDNKQVFYLLSFLPLLKPCECTNHIFSEVMHVIG